MLCQLIEDVVEFIVEQQPNTSIYSQLNAEQDHQSWLDLLTVLIEIYSNWVDQINVELKELSGTSRRNSVKLQEIETFKDFVE